MSQHPGIVDLIEALGVPTELAASLAGGLAAGAGAEFGQRFNRMKTAEARVIMADTTDAADAARRAGAAMGSVLAEEGDRAKDIVVSAFRTRAGWLRANPATLIVAVAGNAVSVAAMAKEGWIDQKTASGAVRRFLNILAAEGPIAEPEP